MSNVTLSANVLNALLTPVGRTLPRKADVNLLTFAEGVLALAEITSNGVVEPSVAVEAVASTTPVQVTPSRKASPRKAKRVVAQSTWQMSAKDRSKRYVGAFWMGEASKAQKARIVKFAADNGFEAFTQAELLGMSAVCAAEWHVYMMCTVNGVEYVEAKRAA